MPIHLPTLLLIPVLLLVTLWLAGLWRAQRENAHWIEQHVVHKAQPRTIDLRRAVYRDLPAPVRQYFDFAFNGRDEVTVDWVDWREQGEFMLPIGRFKAKGGQASQGSEPVYAWTGTFWRFGLPLIESRDAFIGAEHDMRAKLLGWLKVMHTDYADRKDVASLHSYLLLRYFGQAPLMPWALLPNAHVKWRAKDETSAYLEITRPGLTGRYLVRFGGDGHISSMETDRLLMEGNGSMQRETGLKLDYRDVNGFRVPTRMDYKWVADDGRLISHYTFHVESVRHIHGEKQPP